MNNTSLVDESSYEPKIKFGFEFCSVDGERNIYGVDFVGEDIVIFCDCFDELKKIKLGCEDCIRLDCTDSIKYSCYRTLNGRSLYDFGSRSLREDLFEGATPVECPPNRWMDVDCSQNACDNVHCLHNKFPKCMETGCECVSPTKGFINGTLFFTKYYLDNSGEIPQYAQFFKVDSKEIGVFASSKLMETENNSEGITFVFYINPQGDEVDLGVYIPPCNVAFLNYSRHEDMDFYFTVNQTCEFLSMDSFLSVELSSGIVKKHSWSKNIQSYCARGGDYYTLEGENISLVLKTNPLLDIFVDDDVILHTNHLLRTIPCCKGCQCPVNADYTGVGDVPDFVCDIYDAQFVLPYGKKPKKCLDETLYSCDKQLISVNGTVEKWGGDFDFVDGKLDYEVGFTVVDGVLMESDFFKGLDGVNVEVEGVLDLNFGVRECGNHTLGCFRGKTGTGPYIFPITSLVIK